MRVSTFSFGVLTALYCTSGSIFHALDLQSEEFTYTLDGGRYRNSFDWAGPSCPSQRRHLVIAAVGDRSLVNQIYFDDETHRSFDVVMLNYSPSARTSCAKCVGMLRHVGSRWQLLSLLAAQPVWKVIRKQYTHVLLPAESDVLFTNVINELFRVTDKASLAMAHPSTCKHANVPEPNAMLLQKPGTLLEHTNFMDRKTPLFSMEALEKMVLPNLAHARDGRGLERLWPALVDYDAAKIGIIHSVCVFRLDPDRGPDDGSTHPHGWSPREEEQYLLETFGILEKEHEHLRAGAGPTTGGFGWTISSVPVKNGTKTPSPPYCKPSASQTSAALRGVAIARQGILRSWQTTALLLVQLVLTLLLMVIAYGPTKKWLLNMTGTLKTSSHRTVPA